VQSVLSCGTRKLESGAASSLEVEELQRQRDWLAEQLQAAQEELGRLRAVVAAAETEVSSEPAAEPSPTK
jgi:hypothetical protein